MSNYHILTKPVDHEALLAELVAAGVTMSISIDSEKISLSGDLSILAAQLVLVAATESAHTPTTITTAAVIVEPHAIKLRDACSAVPGVTSVTIALPSSYPGTAVLYHNPLNSTQQTALELAVTSHDPSLVPSLSVDTPSQVIAADGVATGTVTVTDSRGASASGKTVKLLFSLGGSAGANADSFVLDGSGQTTVTFQATSTFTGDLPFEFYYPNDEADRVRFTVRRGT
jgi:hypothetical protein